MTESFDGRQVVGMDLRRQRSVLVRMTEDGRKLGTARVANSPGALRAEIARAGVNPRVVLEATYGWYWAADTLAAAGAEVHLAHPLGVKASAASGSRPTRGTPLTWLTCCGWGGCRRRGSRPPEVRDLRELTRYRQKLVGLRSSLQGPGPRGAGQARDRGHLLGPVRRLGQCLARRAAAAAAVCGEGDLAAAADRRAERRDHHADRGDRRPAGRASGATG